MFIVIDGPDGTGKTTVAVQLVELLGQKGKRAVYTTEPSDGPQGRRIREILNSGQNSDQLTELFIADRRDHVDNFIVPRQQEGWIVVSDRYKYSTVCYQHLQTGRPLTELLELNADFPAPDLAVILLVDDSATLMDRIGQRSDDRDIFETQNFLRKNLDLYKQIKILYPEENIRYINAGRSVREVVTDIMQLIDML